MRIAICQESGLPRYRLPAFDLLGAQDGIDLTVFADPLHLGGGELDSVRFRYEARHTRSSRIPGRWVQPAQIEAVSCGRFDLVIMSWNTRSRTLLPALRIARRRGVPVVLWGHGYSKRPGVLRDAIRYRIGRRANGVILYSRSVAERLVARHGFRAERVFVAQNAIDQRPIRAAREKWVADPAALEAFTARHDLDPGRTVIFVSRLLAENRADLLVRAIDLLRRRESGARLVIVGDGPEREALERLAGDLGVRDRVRFAGAIYEDDALAPWMLSSALFSYPVNIGLSIFHAFGYGLPVVTSDDLASHNPEIEALEPGASGLLYRDGDVEDMAAQWKRLIDDPAERARLGRRALELVETKYTLENMVQGLLDATRIVDSQARTVRPT